MRRRLQLRPVPVFTLKCISNGTPKAINIPFAPNGNKCFHVSKYLSALRLYFTACRELFSESVKLYVLILVKEFA